MGRGSGSTVVSTCCARGMAWPSYNPEGEPILGVSLKCICKPADHSASHWGSGTERGLQYCTGMKCPQVKQNKNHSCSWGFAGSQPQSQQDVAVATGLLWSSVTVEWVGTGASTEVGNVQ